MKIIEKRKLVEKKLRELDQKLKDMDENGDQLKRHMLYKGL